MVIVLEKENHLLKTKLILKSVSEFTDEQAKCAFLNAEIRSENDIEELVDYLKEYRPALYQKLNEENKE